MESFHSSPLSRENTDATLATTHHIFQLTRVICDRLCENRTCRGINKNAVYLKIGGKRKFMDLLIMNSPVSLGIVLSIR